MNTKFFFVIYVHNPVVKNILDSMRLVADSSQKNFAHITVKGPYRTSQKKRLMEDSQLISGKEIKVKGAGNFFQDDQNTVFFKCENNEELYNIWKTKEDKTYKEFNPHITIYDGKDRKFALKLFQVIEKYHIDFSFNVDKLELYSSFDKSRLFNLKTSSNYDFLSKVANAEITADNIHQLSNTERINIIDKLCETLKKSTEHTLQKVMKKEYELLVDA